MTISFVGSNTQIKNDGNAISMSLPATVQGDLVVVFTGCRDESKGGPPLSGYTEIADLLYATAAQLRLHASYKFMGAIQDTLVGVAGTGNPQIGTLAMALVFRGVSTVSPLDVTVTTNLLGGSSQVPFAPAITPVNDNCCIVIAAASSVEDATVGTVPGYLPSPSVQTAGTVGTPPNSITAAAAYKILTTAVAQSPTAWTTWTTGAFVSVSIALRPQTVSTDFNTVDKGTVTTTGKAVAERELVVVNKATIGYAGQTLTTPDAKVEAIFVDKYRMVITGKTVDIVETFRAVTVTPAAVLVRGRIVTPREIVFEDVPRYRVKGRGSGHWMETR